MQVMEPQKVYPVIVIGSGAAGGMAAWNLTRKGVEVLLLDAGDKFDRTKFWTTKPRILDGRCAQIGCGAHHGCWKTRRCCGALLGGG